MPRIKCQSSGLTEAARTRTNSSSSPTAGTSTSRSSRTSGEPYLSNRIAFMVQPFSSAANESWLAPFDECLRCFAMILGQPGADVVGDLDVHAVAQLAADGAVEVLLHVAVRQPRAVRETAGALHYLAIEVSRWEHGVNDSEALGIRGRKPVREVVQLLG